MKILALVILIVLLAAVGWLFLIPSGIIYILHAPIGVTITISRGEIDIDSGPDRFPTNGLQHIDAYVARLAVPSERYRFLQIFTPDGTRGFGLTARGAEIEAGFVLDTRSDLQREEAIRTFFDSERIAPSVDYLAETTRVLHYPIPGDAAEVTALTRRILQELCGVSPSEALEISHGVR